MNPSKDPPPKVFIDVLKEWITTQSLTKTMVNTLILENYYKCYEIIDIFNLKEVFNNDMIVKFLQQDAIGIIVVLSITKFNRQVHC